MRYCVSVYIRRVYIEQVKERHLEYAVAQTDRPDLFYFTPGGYGSVWGERGRAREGAAYAGHRVRKHGIDRLPDDRLTLRGEISRRTSAEMDDAMS